MAPRKPHATINGRTSELPAGDTVDPVLLGSGTRNGTTVLYGDGVFRTQRDANVRDYGAVGDGVADDTVAFTSAFATGRSVYVPPGIYLVSQLNAPPAGRIEGYNSGTYNNTFTARQVSILKLKNGANTDLLFVPKTSNRVIIRDLQLDGNKGTQTTGTGACIRFEDDVAQNEAQAIVERCYTHDARGSGLHVGSWRQACHITDHVSNFNAQYGIRLVGTDAIITRPICGDNTLDGVSIEANVTMLTGGALYNNRNGVNIYSGIKGVKLVGNGIDKNLRQGVYISASCDSIALIGNTMTSNGRETANTYPHVQVATTAGGITLTGNSFRDREPGTLYDNLPSYAVLLDPGATALDAGNTFVATGSVGGYTNAPERLYSSSTPKFRETTTLWLSNSAAAVAGQGLDIPVALTEFDVPFAGTRRTLTPAEGGREVRLAVRVRSVAWTTPNNSIVFSVRDVSNTANILATVTVVQSAVNANYEVTSTWAAAPAWFTGAASTTVAVYTSGGDGADDLVVRNIDLAWRG